MKSKMTKLLYLLAILLVPAGLAHADLNAYLDDLNIYAHSERGHFTAELGARFHVGNADVEVVLSNVDNPADAALIFWLGEKARLPYDRVLRVYREQKSQGWGAMAKSLGIKPGSSEFHALKQGNLGFSSSKHNGSNSKNNKGHGNGKGKKK